MFRWRIPDSRSVASVVQELQADGNVRSVQPNFRFTLQQAAQAQTFESLAICDRQIAPDGSAYGLAQGDGVLIAVIDSGIDVAHPEIAGVIAGTFDALRSDGRSRTFTAPASRARLRRMRG